MLSRLLASLLPIAALLITVSNAHWPICYDYAVKDGCYRRDPDTGEEKPELGLSRSNCYYSEPWTEESTYPWVPQGVGAREGKSNTGGHESDLALTLPLCPNEIRRSWREETEAVDRECDYKISIHFPRDNTDTSGGRQTYQGVQRCGNCWTRICEFHNRLHWNDPLRGCTQQLFIYRMQCYSDWYDRYCGSPSLDAAGEQRFLAPNKEGVYPRCSSDASSLAPPLYAALLLNVIASLYSSETAL